MTARINPTTLMNAVTAATTGAWYDVDYVADGGTATRSYAGTLTSGDTINIDVALDSAKSIVVTVATTTATAFNGSIAFPIYSIRARKVGTTGPATVIGMI